MQEPAEQRDPLLDEVDTMVFTDGAMACEPWIKIVHRDTGIEVISDTEPTQLENRIRALAMLRERLTAQTDQT